MLIDLGAQAILSGTSLKDKDENNPCSNQELLISFNPATEQTLAKIKMCTAKQYEIIVNISQNEFTCWQMVPAPKRAELVRLIGNLLRENKAELGKLVSLEMGKSLQEGEGEVQEMIDMADFAVGLSRMLYGKTIPSERENHRIIEQWHPYGVVGVISAFNFPVAVWSCMGVECFFGGNLWQYGYLETVF